MGPDQTARDADVDRRAFIKRAAVITWSTPVILTLMAESAAASHPDECIHLEGECGTYNSSTKKCDTTGSCCSGTRCVPTLRRNGQPCICQ